MVRKSLPEVWMSYQLRWKAGRPMRETYGWRKLQRPYISRADAMQVTLDPPGKCLYASMIQTLQNSKNAAMY